MKIVIAGEIYSENLGDPLIAAALKELLQTQGAQVDTIDFGGRDDYPQYATEAVGQAAKPTNRSAFRSLLSTNTTRGISGILRNLVRGRLQQLVKRWDRQLEDADGLLIGGGQLLHDRNLEFPLRIFLLGQLARRRGIPYAIFGCGASDDWTPFGKAMLLSALRGASYVSVRDEASRRQLTALKSLRLPVACHPDPVFTLRTDAPAPETQTVGVNVMSLSTLRPFLPDFVPDSDDAGAEYWPALARQILAAGKVPVFFSNGAPVDQRAVEAAAQACSAAGLAVRHLPRPTRPEMLLDYLSRFSEVIAMRMHAGVAANALGVPVAAMRWDRKVAGVWARAGGTNVIDAADLFGPGGRRIAECAMEESLVVARNRETLLEQTSTALRECLDSFGASPQPQPLPSSPGWGRAVPGKAVASLSPG